MHWDRSNLFERDDLYCAPVPTETTEKRGVLVESNRCIMELNKQCEELQETMDNLKKKVKFQGANY